MSKEFREFLEDELCRVRKMNEDILSGYGEGVYDSYAYILKKYDEFHKPVVVPDFMAEWIESPDRDLDDMYIWERPKNVYEWAFGESDSLENSRLKDLLDAITNGYEVEDEQKYYVKLPNTNSTSEYLYLTQGNVTGDYWFNSRLERLDYEANICKHKFTEKEIKAIDERYLAFKVPVEACEYDK